MTPSETERRPLERLPVDLGERSYDIVLGEGLLDRAGVLMRPVLARPRVVVVTDEHVAALYLGKLQASMAAAGIRCESIVLPAGEGTKDLAHLGDLADRLLDLRIDRTTTLVALGGGVVGDITGFAAAILLRGLSFVQVPTTLLAQVDSSVGGKTGINTRHGKNLLGAFHQPLLVIADMDVLDSLSPREFLAGYAETVKYGLLGDGSFFDWLDVHGEALCAGDKDARRRAVFTSCRMKAEIVAADEREADRRALLNFGHTFGHALEAETGFGERLLHGEAVAIGMVMAFEMSARLGLCPTGDVERTRRHLSARGLPTRPGNIAEASWTAERMVSHMRQDKKTVDGKLTLILARGIGDAFIERAVDEAAVLALWQQSLRAGA